MVAELELILESPNRVYATLDSTSTIFAHSEADPIRPVGTIPHRIFGSADRNGGMGTHGIARPKSVASPATRHARVRYKKKKNSKKQILRDIMYAGNLHKICKVG